MTKPIVAFTHSTGNLGNHYAAGDLERLAQQAEIRILGDNRFEAIRHQLADVRILVGSWGMPRLDRQLLDAAPQLTAVCYAAGSVKGFVTDEAFERGILITTAMHANAIPVAEVTVALITLANKGWLPAVERIRNAGRAGVAEARRLPHVGNFGSVVGLIGFGAIGREVLERLRLFDCRILIHDPHVDPALIAEAEAEAEGDLHRLAAACDVLSLHAPNLDATAGMCDAAFFAAMRTGATFINTARGRLVDEQALLAELRSGRISAMLDVTDPEPPEQGHPFYSLPNCWLTPHRAGSSSGEVRRMGRYAIEECLRLLAGEDVRYRVLPHMLATMA